MSLSQQEPGTAQAEASERGVTRSTQSAARETVRKAARPAAGKAPDGDARLPDYSEAPIVEVAVEAARRSIKAHSLQLPVDMARAHLQAIDAIHDSVLATLRLARAVSDAAFAGDMIALYPGPHAAAMRHAALIFVQSALGMVGATAMSAAASDAMRKSAEKRPAQPDAFVERCASLTGQQRVVLNLICEGLANKVIAYRLGICESTVKAHVSRILRTMGAPSRARAIALMAKHGDKLAADASELD